MKQIILLLLTLIATLTSIYANDTDKIRYMTEEYPPYNFMIDSQVKGISPDLLRLMWKKMHMQEQPIEMLPWARGYKLTLNKQNHLLMSMTRIKEREELFKWVGPIASSKYVFITLTNSKIDISSIEEVKNYRIGNIRGDATEQMLKSANFKNENIIKINKITQAIKMLKAKRIDFIAFEEGSFFKILKEQNEDIQNFKSVLIFKEVEDYYAFNKNTPEHTIKKFQDALNSLKKEHKEILDYYMK